MSVASANIEEKGAVFPDTNGSQKDAGAIYDLVPWWLLWTVVLWENVVNLNLNAVYTESFLSAPLLIAGAKWLMLAISVKIYTFTSRRHGDSPALLKELLSCWLLSAMVWSVWIAFYALLGPGSQNMESTAPDLHANDDPLMTALVNIFGTSNVPANIVVYALETAAMLAFGICLALAFNWLRCQFLSWRNQAARVAHFGSFSLRSGLVCAFYIVFNGFFAWLIRLGA